MQLGGGWGLGIVSAVVGATLAAGHSGETYPEALRRSLVTCLLCWALSLLLVTTGLGLVESDVRPGRSPTHPPVP